MVVMWEVTPGTPVDGDLAIQDVDDEHDAITPNSHARIEDVLNEQIELTHKAIAASCKCQIYSLRDRLQAAYANNIGGNSNGIEALSNELQKLRKENVQLREALGSGCKAAESTHGSKFPVTSDSVMRSTFPVTSVMKFKPADNGAVLRNGASHMEHYTATANLPGAVDSCDQKVHERKTNKVTFYVDGLVQVPVPSNILADRAPPSLPSTNNLLSSSPPSPRKSTFNSPRVRVVEPEDPEAGQHKALRHMGTRSVSRANSKFLRKSDTLMSISAIRHPEGRAHKVFADADAMKEKVRQTICQDTYDVQDFYKKIGLAQWIARSQLFDYTMLFIIASNAIWIGYDTDYNTSESLYDAPPLFIVAENAFCVIFLFEWIVRFSAFEIKRNIIRDTAFLFDTALVAFMIVETWVTNVVIKFAAEEADGTKATGASGFGNASVLRLLRLLRLTRMARMARLLRAMPELMILVKGMAVAMRSVVLTLGLLVIVLYVFGIAFTQLARDTVVGVKYFSCVGSSMNTLLNHATLLEGMPEVINEIGAEFWLFRALFLLHVLLASLTVLNMLVGVLVEVVSVVSAVEKEQLQVNFVKARLSQIIADLNIDEDENGMVSRDEFVHLLARPEATRALRDVGVDVVGLVDFQDYIFVDDRTLSFSQFMEVVLSLRGTNKATVKDIVDVRKWLRAELDKIESKLTFLISRQSEVNTVTKGKEAPRRGCHFGQAHFGQSHFGQTH